MLNFVHKDRYNVYDLAEIVRLLRSKDGCPWDREQTHESIRRNFIEETYEVCEAIDEKNPEHLCEELGDVLTQVVFHAQLETEAGRFDLDDVADMVCKKLIYRHPHVFGDVQVADSAEVLSNWDDLKRKEKKQASTTAAMDAVARSLPGLWRAEKIQSKAKKVGFDWPDAAGAMDKLQEELQELQEAMQTATNPQEELGDLLFSAVNVARHLGIDPEDALSGACDKFISRFAYVESAAKQAGQALTDMTLEEMDKLYDASKQNA